MPIVGKKHFDYDDPAAVSKAQAESRRTGKPVKYAKNKSPSQPSQRDMVISMMKRKPNYG
jgi:hypothetical protein